MEFLYHRPAIQYSVTQTTGEMLTIYDRMVMDCSSWLARLEIGAVVMCITIPVVWSHSC